MWSGVTWFGSSGEELDDLDIFDSDHDDNPHKHGFKGGKASRHPGGRSDA
jgi:hypothetical protein